MNTMNGYADPKMKLSDVCDWLRFRSYGDVASLLSTELRTKENGLIRVDVLKDIFVALFDEQWGVMFRAMECDVITYMDVIPYSEAHVD